MKAITTSIAQLESINSKTCNYDDWQLHFSNHVLIEDLAFLKHVDNWWYQGQLWRSPYQALGTCDYYIL